MKPTQLFSLLAAAGLLAACDFRVRHDDDNSNATGNVSAAGKSEEGQLSVSAPGFEMKLGIPEGVRSRAGVNDDSGLIYPNAQFSGIHVEGGADGSANGADGEVELRFNSVDSPELIARWYQDPARQADFSLASATREGEDHLLAGTTKDDNGRFNVRLSPRAGGGTEGRVVLANAS